MRRLLRRERRLRRFARRVPSIAALAGRPRHLQGEGKPAGRGHRPPASTRLARRAVRLVRDCWYGATTAAAAIALLVALHTLTTPDADLEPYPLDRQETGP